MGFTGSFFELHGCLVLKAKAKSLQSSACWNNSGEHRVTPRPHYLQLFKSLKCHMPPKHSLASVSSSRCLLFCSKRPHFHSYWFTPELSGTSEISQASRASISNSAFQVLCYRQDSIRQTTESCQAWAQRFSIEILNNRVIYDIKSNKSFFLSLLSRKPVSCELYQKVVTLKVWLVINLKDKMHTAEKVSSYHNLTPFAQIF